MTTTDGAYRCVNHPARETMVRCGKCEKPLCTECMIMTPVGVRCRSCANLKPIPTYDVGPLVMLRAAVVAFPVAIVLATLIRVTPIGAFGFFLMPFYGWLTAEAVARVSNQKRGPRLQVITAFALIAGLVVASAVPLVFRFGGPFVLNVVPALLVSSLMSNLFNLSFLFQLGLALVFGLSRLR